jgi:TRAP-type C4-dicarboxylate transport system permease small subunit
MRLTGAYLKANRAFEKIEKAVAVVIISLIVLIVFAATLSRYLFSEPIFGADRLATYMMVWLGFIGFQIATSKLRHIEVEFLKARVKPDLKYLMNIITSLLATVFLFTLFWLSFTYMNMSREMGDKDIVLNIPIWWIILILPLSFLISAIRYFFAVFLWLDIAKGRRKEEDIAQKQLM